MQGSSSGQGHIYLCTDTLENGINPFHHHHPHQLGVKDQENPFISFLLQSMVVNQSRRIK